MKSRHHGGFAPERARHRVDAGARSKMPAGEMLMRMAGDQHVDPVEPGQRGGGVFHQRRRLARPDAGMRQRHDDLGPLRPEPRDSRRGGFQNVTGGEAALQHMMFPTRGLHRGKAEDADPDLVKRAVISQNLAQQQQVGGEQRVVRFGPVAATGQHVG